ncbi:GerAB/ArcD/ProY family transporter [Ammoniphilus sp. CFH 90114]|uniref:YkvI family membrane protein n=1 Tax=Ammoniphilus sp. CFH 90114 TaxID=2493665 RepID=UPI00100E8270|nr:GerAB/ArcD/ProY family transporter [Ammoniphilus sp. CFH 90114]RXT08886.1 hypothetical protein EIZ39_08785 [Ammoniphilus sp. CFH 90114]
MWRAVKIGLTIIGTTIGAGFASGREIWEFFGSYGVRSQYSLLLAMVLFFIMVIVVLNISKTKQTANYYGVLEALMGKRLAAVFDVLTMLYLLSMSVVMFAGSGATFAQWNYSYMIGVLFIAVMVFVVLLFDVKGLVSIQSFIIPVLIGVLLFVCIRFIMGYEAVGQANQVDTDSWPSGITYAALNIVPLIAVLSTLGGELKTRRELWVAGLVSTAGLASIALLMNYSLMQMSEEISTYEIPLFSLLQQYPTGMIIVVSVILWLAIYTTALSGVHGIVSRVSSILTVPSWVMSFILILLMIPLSQFGFSTLVSVLYPIYGVLNLFVLGLLILYPISRRLESRP